MSSEDLERAWGIQNWEGIEERCRDEALWLFSGFFDLLAIRCFYYHLRESCNADYERVSGVKRCLRKLQTQIIRLRNDLTYCSPLGPMLYNMRHLSGKTISGSIGTKSIRHLEKAGIRTVAAILNLPEKELVQK